VAAEQVSEASSSGWAWDPTPYAGAARYDTTGRVAYPAGIADTLVKALGLDGTGGLLDVGCGPESFDLLDDSRRTVMSGAPPVQRRLPRRKAGFEPATSASPTLQERFWAY
jgi:hypothetical protein